MLPVTCAVFGAVEPKDLLGFGVPLADVLQLEGKQRQQQQQVHQQQAQEEAPAFVVDVAVVGAGVAGLAAAAYLRRCGASVLVFEGRQRVGGHTFSSVLPQRTLPDGRKVESELPKSREYADECLSSDVGGCGTFWCLP